MKKVLETDMHIHTNVSDGEYSPINIYKMIKKTNINVFSITDHDTVSGAKQLQKYLKYNDKSNIIYIPGIEITTNIKNKKYKTEYSKLHLLGYDFDLNHPEIKKLLNKKRIINKINIENKLQILENLTKIKFSKEELNYILRKSYLGTIDITKILIKKKLVTNYQEAKEKYYSKIPEINIPYVYEEEVLQAIKKAGGYTSIAHPTSLRLNLDDLKEYLKTLKDQGLDAVEVYHSKQSLNYSNKIREITNDLNLYISGGSDYHGPNIKPRVNLGINKQKTKKLTLDKQIINHQ